MVTRRGDSGPCGGFPSLKTNSVDTAGRRGRHCHWLSALLSHLVLLSTSLFVVVEHILSDVLPAVVVSGHVVHALLQALVAPPASVQEDPKQENYKGHQAEIDTLALCQEQFSPCSNVKTADVKKNSVWFKHTYKNIPCTPQSILSINGQFRMNHSCDITTMTNEYNYINTGMLSWQIRWH